MFKYQNLRKFVQWETSCSIWIDDQTERQTDMTKLIVVYAILRTRLRIQF